MPHQDLLGHDPLWFKDAVIYELHVRAFGDSDGDGIGDFDGLTARLDYLQELGVTALWLLPFYPSPLRDDGYDIADYGGINPAYGTLRSFRRFLDEAHRRGLRVITELVLNHTSDQHPWFQRSRRAKPGTRWRDYYVWSDHPDRYPEVRVIFEDYETSNWTWDPVAGAYYWHRFFHHQPDLNYDNPEVREVMLRAVDRWLEMGVDGVRLDAVPYLFERDGTNGENLPETHGFLKELRRHVDATFPGRMLLAEANQWPEDAVAYFGDGDECHMSFHFPVMPRLFMALRLEDRFPVIDILQQTPTIPDTCQWAIFLRNHDELTLEMVTDEERDYMYRAYAADPRMRVNLGIRRRLAPLLGNDRRKIQLMNGLLFSLPGTPVIYYGDELGMGDNVYLGDRDGVRTPMQWSPDRAAGFSRGNPQSLYLPVIIDPDFHFETINVESQERNSSSLLWWMRRIISVRQQHPVFGRGELEFLYPENAKVLAFVRRDEHETVLVLANLSRHAQQVQLDLHQFRGAVPVELFGGTEFAPLVEGQGSFTLGPYGFYWLLLDTHRQESRFTHPETDELPVLVVPEDWRAAFRGRSKAVIERALPAYLLRNRWYAGRQRVLRSVTIADAVPLQVVRGRPGAFLALLHAEYTDGEPETYVAPLTTTSGGERAAAVLADHPSAGVAWLEPRGTGERLLLHDAMVDNTFAEGTLTALRRRKRFASPSGAELVTSLQPGSRRALQHDELTPHVPLVEQSNSSVVFGNHLVLKVFRRAQEGVNPDLEIGRLLAEKGFAHTAPLVGAVEYQRGRSEPRTIALLTEYVPNEGDAWRYTLDALGLYYERAIDLGPDGVAGVPAWDDLLDLVGRQPPDPLAEAIGPYLDSAELLGRRTADLHLTLGAPDTDDERFRPEPFSTLWQRSLYQAMRAQVRPTMQLLRRVLPTLDERARRAGEALLGHEAELLGRFAGLTRHRIDTVRIRVHGDFHLGQVLHVGRDFAIIDFEGEPSRTPTERRIKRSAVADVAGMVRSFQYAAEAGYRAFEERGMVHGGREAELRRRGRAWQRWVTVRFLTGYLDRVGDAPLVPADRDDLRVLLGAYVYDKALYEIRYDLAHRPHWAGIPLVGLTELLGPGG